jgi:beta-glucosidase
VKAIGAGLDLEMPSPLFVNDRVGKAVARGILPQARVDDAALRLIRQQLRFASVGDGNYDRSVVACDEHRALAREAATKGIVLLRNESAGRGEPGRPLLPFDPADLRRLAVIGRLADQANTGDHGSSDVTPPYVVTPLAGLQRALGPVGVEVTHDDGSQLERAKEVAASADAVILVAGFDHRDEGEYLGEFGHSEAMKLLPRPPLMALPRLLLASTRQRRRASTASLGGDRRSLALHSEDETLIQAVAAANPRTVVALVCGSAVLMERWRHSVEAILILWYAGMEGGNALADIVLGREKPTGRLPFAIPTSPDHLPAFDPDATVVTYDGLHGQTLLDHLGVPAAYPFGFGLSYDRPDAEFRAGHVRWVAGRAEDRDP